MGSLRARGLGVVWSPDWGDVKGAEETWQAVRHFVRAQIPGLCHSSWASTDHLLLSTSRSFVPEAAVVLQFADAACQISKD